MQVWAIALGDILKASILVFSTYFYKIFLPRSSLYSRISICLDHSQLDLISHLLVVHLKKKKICYNGWHKGHLVSSKFLFIFPWAYFSEYIFSLAAISLPCLLFSLPTFSLLPTKSISISNHFILAYSSSIIRKTI